MGCEKLTEADLSGHGFSGVSNLTRMFYGDTRLDAITLPADFGTGVTDASTGGKNIFCVAGETPTYLDIQGDAIPAFLTDYDWTGDNRSFLIDNGTTVDGSPADSHLFTAESTEPVCLKYDVTCTFPQNNTPADVLYSWSYDDGNAAAGLLQTTDTLSVWPGHNGIYTAAAGVRILTYSPVRTAAFTIGMAASVSGITAEYTGPDVYTESDYDKNDVKVTAVYSDGTSSSVTDFTVDRTKVTSVGLNTYTVSYTDVSGTDHKTSFSVNGIKPVILKITAAYAGKDIPAGSSFDKSDVIVLAEYDNGDMRVLSDREYSLDGTLVRKAGNNTFTATYKEGKVTCTSAFTVTGTRVIGSIEVSYGGPDVTVGQSYDTSCITCTAFYTDDQGNVFAGSFKVSGAVLTARKASSPDSTGTTASPSSETDGISDDSTPAVSADDSGTAKSHTQEIGVKTGDTIDIRWLFVAFGGFVCLIILLLLEKKRNR